MADAGVEGGGYGETESGRGVRFRDHSPWVENQSRRNEVGDLGCGVCVCVWSTGMDEGASATQSRRFNFSHC